jgi:hypothetical protein
MMKQLNWAYKLFIEYCNNYSYTFNQDDVARKYPHDEYPDGITMGGSGL